MKIELPKIIEYKYDKYGWLIKNNDDIVGFCSIKNYKLLKMEKPPIFFTYINCKQYYDNELFLNVNNESLKNKIDEYFTITRSIYTDIEYI